MADPTTQYESFHYSLSSLKRSLRNFPWGHPSHNCLKSITLNIGIFMNRLLQIRCVLLICIALIKSFKLSHICSHIPAYSQNLSCSDMSWFIHISLHFETFTRVVLCSCLCPSAITPYFCSSITFKPRVRSYTKGKAFDHVQIINI